MGMPASPHAAMMSGQHGDDLWQGSLHVVRLHLVARPDRQLDAVETEGGDLVGEHFYRVGPRLGEYGQLDGQCSLLGRDAG
jgi:hypothetical protein